MSYPYLFTLNLHSKNIAEQNFHVTVNGQGANGMISNEEDDEIAVSGAGEFNASVSMDLDEVNYLHVYIDPNAEVSEDKSDNYVLVPVIQKKIKANLSVDTGYPLVDQAIKDYLRFFVDDKPQAQADFIISIGRYTDEVSLLNQGTLSKEINPFGFESGQIRVDGKYLSMPYSGLVAQEVTVPVTNYVFVYGNRIEGTIAAVRKMISARSQFFASGYHNRRNVLDTYDASAIAVYDLFHNEENEPYFRKNTPEFADVVTDILNDNTFEISIKTVKTTNDNTTLRLKHINSDFSLDFQEAIANSSKPVVFAGGIFSDLFAWNELATELATDSEQARDSWLIEITGGPGQDCDTCPDYTYEDLVDYPG